jgi:hypothetical protein
MDWYGAPGGEYASKTKGRIGNIPFGPEFVGGQLFDERGPTSQSCPMTRGIMPDRHLGTRSRPRTTR